tara:strand:- start:23 stop:712 length:690 start_codon:yes stop_codon:yes gene_type:complete
MRKLTVIFILLIFTIIVFNKQLISKYYSYKFSKWVERKVTFDNFEIKYPNSVSVTGIKILNSNSNSNYYENIFEAQKIDINFNLKSLLFDELIVINDLGIERPKIFLEIIEKNPKLDKSVENRKITYEDNIGIAKKIYENLPDKIWPEKKRDINFVILKSNISEGRTFIKVSSIEKSFEILMSDMEFFTFGNKKEHQHYKNILKIIFFDIIASTKDFRLKRLLIEIYKL